MNNKPYGRVFVSDDGVNNGGTMADEGSPSQSRLQTAGLMVGSTVAVTLGLMAPFVVLRTPLPYMATPGYKVKRALEFVSSTLPSAAIKGKMSSRRLFVDLGSGDGEAVYQAARCGYRAIGMELNWTLWGISMIRRSLWPSELRRRTEFRRRDFFSEPLPSDASVVMVFGVTPLMHPLSLKLAKECQPGSHVLSYRFWLPTSDSRTTVSTANRTHGVNSKDKEGHDPRLMRGRVVYDVEDMHIYEIEHRKSDSTTAPET